MEFTNLLSTGNVADLTSIAVANAETGVDVGYTVVAFGGSLIAALAYVIALVVTVGMVYLFGRWLLGWGKAKFLHR